jgi:hypothetical protein
LLLTISSFSLGVKLKKIRAKSAYLREFMCASQKEASKFESALRLDSVELCDIIDTATIDKLPREISPVKGKNHEVS